ncbi:hypothetical protein L208DRAFT_511184 [Tricholoma matsutake]|nr:hypothetical protein L208DRAFT_511184 [Tricholoma matsutake 945]
MCMRPRNATINTLQCSKGSPPSLAPQHAFSASDDPVTTSRTKTPQSTTVAPSLFLLSATISTTLHMSFPMPPSEFMNTDSGPNKRGCSGSHSDAHVEKAAKDKQGASASSTADSHSASKLSAAPQDSSSFPPARIP